MNCECNDVVYNCYPTNQSMNSVSIYIDIFIQLLRMFSLAIKSKILFVSAATGSKVGRVPSFRMNTSPVSRKIQSENLITIIEDPHVIYSG